MSSKAKWKTFFCIFLYLIMYIKSVYAEQLYARTGTDMQQSNDVTKGLSNAEVDMALSDLTVDDLNVLTKLIDKPNAADYYYYDEDNTYLSSNQNYRRSREENDADQALEEPALYDYYDDIDEPNPRKQQDWQRYKIPREALAFVEQSGGQRRKRENTQPQQITVDAEYIRQLENSFPRDQELNNHEDGYDKKEHVRVKRN